MSRGGFMDVPSHCSCSLPTGHRGTTGWHFRLTSHEGSDRFEAYERCPAYWKEAGAQIDPMNRKRLLGVEKTKAIRRVRV